MSPVLPFDLRSAANVSRAESVCLACVEDDEQSQDRQTAAVCSCHDGGRVGSVECAWEMGGGR